MAEFGEERNAVKKQKQFLVQDLPNVVKNSENLFNILDTAPLLRAPQADFSTDILSRPEHCTIAEYELTPVDKFGFKMLHQMGWKDGETVGRNKRNRAAKPIEYISRPNLLGLGATPAPCIKSSTNYAQHVSTDGSIRHYRGLGEKSTVVGPLAIGSLARIQRGRHQGMLGVVAEISKVKEKKAGAMVTISLASVGTRLQLSEYDIVLLTKNQYDSESRAEKLDTKIRAVSQNTIFCWLRAGLRVRVVSRSIDGGRWYYAKASVEDVLPGAQATLLVNDSRGKSVILDRVPQEALETIVPSIGRRVKIVCGDSAGSIGEIVEKTLEARQCVVTLDDGDAAVLNFSEICEFVF